MILKKLVVGEIETNCYIVFDEKTNFCAVIDPGDKALEILAEIKALGGCLKAIFLTHGHFDHMLAAQELKQQTGAPIYLHKDDVFFIEIVNEKYSLDFGVQYQKPQIDKFFEDGMTVKVGELEFKVFNTKGHSKGSCVLLCEDCMFSGDTLFERECGRCDLPGGSLDEMYASLKKLAELYGDYKVYPGHGEDTLLSYERLNNPYMKEALARQ